MTTATNAPLVMTPRETLAEDGFKIEETLDLFGRPVGVVLTGFWSEDGAEAMLGVVATEPLGFCHIIAALRYTPGEPLEVGRVTVPDDPRDDTGVIERFFEQPLDQVLAAIFGQMHDAFAAAAELREERAGKLPVREMPAPAPWVH